MILYTSGTAARPKGVLPHPDVLEPMFTEIHLWRTPELDFEVDGHR